MYFHSPYPYRMSPRCLPGPELVSEDTDTVLTFMEQKIEKKQISKCNKSKSVGIVNKWEQKC